MTKRYYKYAETHRTVRGRKQKYCTKCNLWKAEREFSRDRAKRDGLKSRCKDCDTAYAREPRWRKRNIREYLRFEQRHRIVNGVRQKLCSRCKQWENESDFYRDGGAKDGLASRCRKCDTRPCRRHRGQDRRVTRRNLSYEQRHRVVAGVKQKLCGRCGQWRDESDFYRHRWAKDGLAGWCRECEISRARKHPGQGRESGRRNLRYEQRHRVVDGVREKLCTKCGKWKKESAYCKDRARKDGLTGLCRKCSHAATAKSRK